MYHSKKQTAVSVKKEGSQNSSSSAPAATLETTNTADVGHRKPIKLVPFSMLRKELFKPERQVNKDTDQFMEELGVIIAHAILYELHHPQKAAVMHLSSKNGKYSWNNTTEKEKDNGSEIMAVNDIAESAFGALTD